jgi:hypothetical protein
MIAMNSNFNIKYNQAIMDSTNHCSVFKTTKYLSQRIRNSETSEYQENFFNKQNLLNSNYNDLKVRDFEKYYYLCDTFGYINHGKDTLKQILNDEESLETPILIRGKNDIFWQLIGNIEMMAFKVLGISPLVREIKIKANIEI